MKTNENDFMNFCTENASFHFLNFLFLPFSLSLSVSLWNRKLRYSIRYTLKTLTVYRKCISQEKPPCTLNFKRRAFDGRRGTQVWKTRTNQNCKQKNPHKNERKKKNESKRRVRRSYTYIEKVHRKWRTILNFWNRSMRGDHSNVAKYHGHLDVLAYEICILWGQWDSEPVSQWAEILFAALILYVYS